MGTGLPGIHGGVEPPLFTNTPQALDLAPCHPPSPLLPEDGNGASLKLAGRMGSYNSVSSMEASSALRSASPLDVHQAGAEPEAGASNIPGRPHIYPMPDNPLALLRQLHELLKVRGGAGWVGGVAVGCLVVDGGRLHGGHLLLRMTQRSTLGSDSNLLTSTAAGGPAAPEVPGGAAQHGPPHRLLGPHPGPQGVHAGGAMGVGWGAVWVVGQRGCGCHHGVWASCLQCHCGVCNERWRDSGKAGNSKGARFNISICTPPGPRRRASRAAARSCCSCLTAGASWPRPFTARRRTSSTSPRWALGGVAQCVVCGACGKLASLCTAAPGTLQLKPPRAPQPPLTDLSRPCLTPTPPSHTPQVPDIYDAAKYDTIHNQHLGLDLKPVYKVGGRGGGAGRAADHLRAGGRVAACGHRRLACGQLASIISSQPLSRHPSRPPGGQVLGGCGGAQRVRHPPRRQAAHRLHDLQASRFRFCQVADSASGCAK